MPAQRRDCSRQLGFAFTRKINRRPILQGVKCENTTTLHDSLGDSGYGDAQYARASAGAKSTGRSTADDTNSVRKDGGSASRRCESFSEGRQGLRYRTG